MENIEYTFEQRLEKWAWETYEAIRANFKTQRINPYPPYITPNAKDMPNRYSTKALYNTLYYKVLNAAGRDQAKVDFFFNYYGLFVEMGVGRGQKYSQVDNAATARYNKRYKPWVMKGDRQSRPAIVMEINFQVRRLSSILSYHYAMAAIRPIYSLVKYNSDYVPGEENDIIISKPAFLK